MFCFNLSMEYYDLNCKSKLFFPQANAFNIKLRILTEQNILGVLQLRCGVYFCQRSCSCNFMLPCESIITLLDIFGPLRQSLIPALNYLGVVFDTTNRTSRKDVNVAAMYKFSKFKKETCQSFRGQNHF